MPALRALPIVVAIARRALPRVVESTLVPAALLATLTGRIGLALAMASALAWSWAAVLRRRLRGRPVPVMLGLATAGATVRTTLALASGQAAIYFVQPLLMAVVAASVFLWSLRSARPLIARFADDFCPLPPDLAARPAVTRLFRRLTVLWAAVHLTTAAVATALLLTLSTPTYVVAKTASGLLVTVTAILVTVTASLRTARQEQLTLSFGPASGSQSRAMVTVFASVHDAGSKSSRE